MQQGKMIYYILAPYLFRFENQGEFNNYFIEKGWGDSWGILISTKVTFDELYNHFKRFLMVKTDDGLQLFFRFYDPRVLRIFLPTCDTKQLKEFFGPIQSFLLEDEDLRFGIKFWLQNGILQSKKIHFREISSSTDADLNIDSTPDKNYNKENNSMVIPKQTRPERNTVFPSTDSGAIKPSKPKWNMLD